MVTCVVIIYTVQLISYRVLYLFCLFVDIPDSSLAAGILPVEIRKLVQSRKQVKGLMKDKGLSKEQYMQVGVAKCILEFYNFRFLFLCIY